MHICYGYVMYVIIYCCVQTSTYHYSYVHIAYVRFMAYNKRRRKVGVFQWTTNRMRHILVYGPAVRHLLWLFRCVCEILGATVMTGTRLSCSITEMFNVQFDVTVATVL
jgi:hypothetical protein